MYEEYVANRLNELQPCSKKLGTILCQLGGNRVSISLDPLSERLIKEGVVYKQQPVYAKMRDLMCHANVWEFYVKQPNSTIHSGYVLQKDTWYRHSWLINHNNNIIETVYNLKDVSLYYGIQLKPKEFLDLLMRIGLVHLEVNMMNYPITI